MSELKLQRIELQLNVHRLAPDRIVPQAVLDHPYCGIWRSPDELSIVCPEKLHIDSDRTEGPFIAWRVPGAMDFSLTGVIHRLTEPLSHANVPVFVVSSFDTDYLLVPSEDALSAERALTDAGIELITEQI